MSDALRAPGAVRRAVGEIIAAPTWLAVIHVLAGVLTGLAAWIVLLVGTTLGLALVVLVVGVPIWLLTLDFCGWFARAERRRFALLLGADFPVLARPAGPGGWWRRHWRSLGSPSLWRAVCYALLRFPVSVVQMILIGVPWSVGAALLTVPAYGWALPLGGPHIGTVVLRGPAIAAAVVLGAALLLVAPPVTMAVAQADAAFTRWLVGSGGRAELTARIGQLETSRAQVVDAAEAERRRIERDLHDGAQQRLVALAMELGRAKAKLGTDPESASEILDSAHEQAKLALTELRNLVRGVHPPVLTDRGLDAALSGLAALSPVPVTVEVALDRRPSAQIEAIAYFVVAEALTNIAKHARASQASVTVERAGDALLVRVSDDGAGGADPAGPGLTGLAGRVGGVDGRLLVTSPPGGPTTIEVRLPCGW